ncbi:hypothetical protein [Streptomyces sp. NPDC059224]
MENNSTLVMPFPVEMLRFFERQSGEPDGEYAPGAAHAPRSPN